MTNAEPTQAAETGGYRMETTNAASFAAGIVALALVIFLAALPVFAGRDLVEELIFVFYMAALAQCWNLLVGYAGLVSVGQQAFVGLGGYLLFGLTIIGGIDTIEGPLLGTMIFYPLQRYLASFGAWYLILLGALAIAVMLYAPKGPWSYLAERYGLILFPTRRRLVVQKDRSGPPAGMN